jgi:hypothetical protein
MISSASVGVATFFCAFLAANLTAAQVIQQPTPPPIVTADAEVWYLSGEPITYAGNIYYPAGAQVAFSPNEMIRSGSYLGVPLYSRTTEEPYSVVYVPLGRGWVQPYMRRRTGDVAGTAGTVPPSGLAATYSIDSTAFLGQAIGPPTLVAGAPADYQGLPRGPIPATGGIYPQTATAAAAPPRTYPTPTSGQEAADVRPMRTRIGPPPQGINAVFVEFRNQRWFGAGQPIPFDSARMIEIGRLHGFPVYVDREAPEQQIFITSALGAATVAPYSARRQE